MRPAGCAHELVVAQHCGHFVLHAPTAGVTCLVNRTMFDRLLALADRPDHWDPDVLAELEPLGLLDPVPRLEHRAVVDPPTQLTIAITRRCSLRCSYCYAEGGASPATVPRGAARRAINTFAQAVAEGDGNRFAVHVHGGGDPGKAWDRTREASTAAVEAAARFGLVVRRTIGLNGMLSPSRARWAARNFEELTISLDGGPAVHDVQRPTVSGGPSLRWVERTLAELDEAGARYGVRMTVTASSVDAMAESVAAICKRCRAPVIQVEPAAALGRHHSGAPIQPLDFVNAFRRAHAVAVANHRVLRYSAASYPAVRDHFCRSLIAGVCLQPEGIVTACYEAPPDPNGRFTIGRWHPATGQLHLDHRRRWNLFETILTRRRQCRGCIAEAHCAGDCPMKNDEGAGNRCQINQALVLDQIIADLEPHPLQTTEALL